MKNLILVFFLLISFLSTAQENTEFGRTYSNVLPSSFTLNASELREDLYSRLPAEFKEEDYQRSSFRFADQSSIQLSYLFSSGAVYSDWNALEDYVNEVFKKAIPEESKDNPMLHVYLIKKGSANAFMTPTGNAFIHIGLLSEINNEATLAAILAHEYAHYALEHSIEGYVKSTKGEFKPRLFSQNNKASKFSISNELQADSMAIVLLKESGYKIQGLIDAFEMNKRNEENQLLQIQDVWEFKATTHPKPDERIQKIKEYYEENKSETSKDYLVSKEKFLSFKNASKSEVLKILLKDFNYYACMRKAFKFHMYDPNNSVYIYYLMESIRRNCYLNPKLWDKNFITNKYYEITEVRGIKQKVEMKAHLFEEVPVDLLCLNSSEKEEIKTMFYWEEEPKFKTYEEAYLFFNQVGELLKEPECILSVALLVSYDKERSNEYLGKYLLHENIQHRSFAENLLNGTIKSGLKYKRLTVFSELLSVVKEGKEHILIRDEKNNDFSQLNGLLEDVMQEFPKRDFLMLTDLRKENLNDYLMLLELERFSFLRVISKGVKTELHILDPRYWEILHKLGTHEIEFINCSYYDNRKYSATVESYKELVALDYNKLLAETNRHRYVDIMITSVRLIEDKAMKIRYYGGEDKLAFKKPAYEQLVELLKRKMKIKDVRAEEKDEIFKSN